MSSPRIFIQKNLIHENTILLDRSALKHLKVLRLRGNDVFTALDGSGTKYEARLNRDEKSARILSKEQIPGKHRTVRLFLSLIKIPRFEIALEKACELGVSAITPVIAERSLLKSISENKMKRWEILIQQASRQSFQPFPTLIGEPVDFSLAVQQAEKSGLTLFPDVSGEDPGWPSIREEIESHDCVNLFIGPEGGFTPEEIQLAKVCNFRIFTLGSNILRTETAAIALCTLTALS